MQQNDELTQLNRMLGDMQAELVRREREIVAAQLVGTAAHNLGQPVTAILLNCHLAERLLVGSDNRKSPPADSDPGISKVIRSIRADGERLRELLQQLVQIDPEQREAYLGGLNILSLQSSEPASGRKSAGEGLLKEEKK